VSKVIAVAAERIKVIRSEKSVGSGEFFPVLELKAGKSRHVLSFSRSTIKPLKSCQIAAKH